MVGDEQTLFCCCEVSGNPVHAEATPHQRKNPAPGACPVSRQTRRGQVVSQVVSQVRAAWARSRMRAQPPTTEVLRVASSKTQSGAALQQEAPAEALGQLPSYPSRRCHQVELCRGLARQMAKHSGRKHRKRRYLACCTQEGGSSCARPRAWQPPPNSRTNRVRPSLSSAQMAAIRVSHAATVQTSQEDRRAGETDMSAPASGAPAFGARRGVRRRRKPYAIRRKITGFCEPAFNPYTQSQKT